MKKIVGYYNYTVIPTYIGFAFAWAGILLAMAGVPTYAVYCLVASCICDMFDGKIARTHKTRTDEEKAFGIQIDSLSDLCSFGVLPAVIGYAFGMDKWYFYPILLFYPLCALIRLGYFNVQEACRQKEETGCRKNYTGVPVTVPPIYFALLFLVYLIAGFSAEVFTWLWAISMVYIPVLFLAPITIKKPGMKGILFWAGVGVALVIALVLVTVLK